MEAPFGTDCKGNRVVSKRLYITALDFGLWKARKNLAGFLQGAVGVDCGRASADKIRVGWGRKPSGDRAVKIAQKCGGKHLLLEDGFLRSWGLGVDGEKPLSLISDGIGIYYDATRPSELETLIKDKAKLTDLLADGERACSLVLTHNLSKYNHAPSVWPSSLLFDENKQNILIIDQTAGDMALRYGYADQNTFSQMLATALEEYPQADIWIKTHPDVLAGKKKGHFVESTHSRVKLFADDINPLFLLARMDAVYTATSQMGFEALLLGKKVITFGVPWYAGWGQTDDRNPQTAKLQQQGRRTQASVLELFTAAYLAYSRYIHPYQATAGTIFDVINYLRQCKDKGELLNGDIYCVGLSWWKKQIIKPFLHTPSNRLHFIAPNPAKLMDLPATPVKVMVWGQKYPAIQQQAEALGLSVLKMEDGFIRSVGLGSNLVPPLSLVIDDLGIYFDAQAPSRLEAIFQTASFSEQTIQQADELIAALVAANVGKYNVGQGGFSVPLENKRKIILVPGQVEDDASIKLGSPAIKKNLDLLKAARAAEPDAYIVFKPHPDVVSGNRCGQVCEADALSVADQIVSEADIISCIMQADEIHTMTSLAGFEALLRRKKVVCYGLPFYAGWGLTEDKLALPRRKRILTLQELVAGAMIAYPLYLHPENGRPTDVFGALSILKQQRAQKHKAAIGSTWLGRRYGQLKMLLKMLWKW